MNTATGAYQILRDQIRLDRDHIWPDGTLNDTNIHRAGHAVVVRSSDGYHLTDTHPVNGNSVYLNDTRMERDSSVKLTSGDLIRLGKTTLIYMMLNAQEG